MDKFLDSMCRRRLCLPSNFDINLLRSGKALNYKTCECIGQSQHIACTFISSKSFLKPLSYGINTYDIGGGVNTMHAEVNAILLLPSLPRKKNLRKIDVLVIKTSANGKKASTK